MSGEPVLGIDIGTTGTKSMLLDTETGTVTGLGYREYGVDIPAAGAAEQYAMYHDIVSANLGLMKKYNTD